METHTQTSHVRSQDNANSSLKRPHFLQTLLVSAQQITVADEEKLNLKKDDANFPWGIGGTNCLLFGIFN